MDMLQPLGHSQYTEGINNCVNCANEECLKVLTIINMTFVNIQFMQNGYPIDNDGS